MKKLIFFSGVLLFGITMMFTSCSKDDDLVDPVVEEVSVDNKSASLKSTSGSMYLPTCSDPSTGTTNAWSNSTLNVNLPTHAVTNQKYIYRAATKTAGRPRFFKVQITNKSTANYPIVVRAVGQQKVWGGNNNDLWFVVNDNGQCRDLLTNNSSRLFNNPDLNNPQTAQRADYVQFEIIVPNRSSTGKNNTSVPVEVKLSSYRSSPWFGSYKKKKLIATPVFGSCFCIVLSGSNIFISLANIIGINNGK